MHHLQLLAFLAATATAAPTFSPRFSNGTSSPNVYYNAQTLDACHAAPNCETYETSRGLAIRFVQGREPGSDWYKNNHALTKRDDSPVTHVTYGKNSLNYGSLGASGTYGAIHHLYDACGEGACDSSDLSYTTTIASDLDASESTLVLHPQGSYNGWDERNVFVDAMVAAAGQGEKCEDKTWMNGGGYGQSVQTGTVHQCTQSTFIAIDRFAAGQNAPLIGFMHVEVDQGDEGTNWCSVISGALGGVAGVIGAVPGAEAAGAASGFFGIISAFCS